MRDSISHTYAFINYGWLISLHTKQCNAEREKKYPQTYSPRSLSHSIIIIVLNVIYTNFHSVNCLSRSYRMEVCSFPFTGRSLFTKPQPKNHAKKAIKLCQVFCFVRLRWYWWNRLLHLLSHCVHRGYDVHAFTEEMRNMFYIDSCYTHWWWANALSVKCLECDQMCDTNKLKLKTVCVCVCVWNVCMYMRKDVERFMTRDEMRSCWNE